VEEVEVIALPVRVESNDWITSESGGVFVGDIIDAKHRRIVGIHTPTGCTGGAHERVCEESKEKLEAVARVLNARKENVRVVRR